jgi:hypothetical protein
MRNTPETSYGERLKRITDAVRLKQPDRVPVLLEFGYFMARYSHISFQDVLYDRTRCVEAYRKTVTELEPDAFHCLSFDSGQAMETIDTRVMKWPGHGLSSNQSHQYIEGEYMLADEYDSFLENPTDFILKTYLPRTCGALSAFKGAPGLFNYLSISRGRITPVLADPQLLASYQAIFNTARVTLEWDIAWKDFVKEIEEKGFPAITLVGIGQAPFDFFSDHLRGMKGTMLDMYRQPDKLLAAMDRMLPMFLAKIKTLKNISKNKLVFMGPHRGAEGFMSLLQFEKFYWPGLKAGILGLIEAGFTPYILWEGNYTSRLKYLRELPPGKIIHRLDRTNIYEARKVLGGDHCLAGGMLPSLLQSGSIQQVTDECRKLIEIVGRDGSYIMGHSTVLDEAKIENVRAMIDATRKYGVYH